jgi:hypothetical protein
VRHGIRILAGFGGSPERYCMMKNNAYINEGIMTFSYLQGWWTDANPVAQSVAAREGVVHA